MYMIQHEKVSISTMCRLDNLLNLKYNNIIIIEYLYPIPTTLGGSITEKINTLLLLLLRILLLQLSRGRSPRESC